MQGIDRQIIGDAAATASNAARIRLYLVRHGEPDSTDGEPDPGLTERGRRQAAALANRLRPIRFDAIYISPLRRALETAEPLLAGRDDAPTKVTADLCEVMKEHALVTVGRASVTTRGHLEAERDAMLRFINRVRHAHDAGQHVLIVAHGNLIRALIPLFGGRDPARSVLMEVHHASLSRLELWPGSGRAVLTLGNGTRHLTDADVTS